MIIMKTASDCCFTTWHHSNITQYTYYLSQTTLTPRVKKFAWLGQYTSCDLILVFEMLGEFGQVIFTVTQ